jgi:hypothetical protein
LNVKKKVVGDWWLAALLATDYQPPATICHLCWNKAI